MQMPFHPAPGLGDLAPGWFALPQNPLTMTDSTVLVPTMSATAPGRWVKTPHLADLVQAAFVVPENPIVETLSSGRGLGCGCGGGCNGSQNFYGVNGLRGLGQVLGTDPVSTWLATNGGSPGQWLADETTLLGFTMPMWGWVAAGFVTAYTVSDLMSRGHAASKRYAGRYAQNPPGNRAIAGYGSTTMNPRGGRVITGYGSTVMNGAGRTNVVFNGRKRRNVAQGYVDSTGFHPIRKSGDYDPDRVDEYYQYAPKKKRRKR